MSDANGIPGSERRVSVRHSCDAPGSCLPAVGGELTWKARVQDISRGGAKLLVQRRFESGTVLHIEIRMRKGSDPVMLLARVVHVSPLPSGEWALGCRFSREMSEDDVRSILDS